MLSLCTVLLSSFFRNRGRAGLRKPMFAGLLAVFLVSFLVMRVPVTLEARDLLAKMVGFTFGLCYLLSLGALFHTTGTDLLGRGKAIFRNNSVLFPLVFLLTVAYFIPDMAGSTLYLEDLVSVSGQHGALFTWAGAGFVFSLMALSLFAMRVEIPGMNLVGSPQLLLVLALVKLVAGGVRGFAELSLIPSVQAGLMKLIHDMVHQMLITVMLPDHPLLTMTAWKYVGLLFGDTLAVWLSLVIMTLPLVLFIIKQFGEEVRVPRDLAPPALKRRFIKSVRDERAVKSIPALLFLLVIVSTWFVQKGEGASRIEKPEPSPVVAEDGMVTIPLHAPGADLLDGALHAYSIDSNGELIRFLLIKRTDNTLAVCLDACELCPPEGYGLATGHVVCLFCRTPIPIDTLGKPGGCNPVPLTAVVTDKDVRIRAADIRNTWTALKAGRARGERAEQ